MSYPPAKFAGADREAALQIAAATRFATLAAVHDGDLLTVHLPLTLVAQGGDGTAVLVGHLLRNNPLFLAMQAGPVAARAMFVPANGYVSPSVYAEKPVSGKVVPTWNYVAAHLDGTADLVAETDLRRILEIQAADYEGATGGDWAVADAPADFVDGLARAIAGFRFAATGYLAIRKLSQNRGEVDRAAVTDWLGRTRPDSGDISWWMAEARQG
ncbi:FMN-binding negative transcriptional regulator [Marinibaculum pumilum]|uniref:FMN-binding negative transcriptional regulator n=1 Tax=Marinibaculum pumilum TaxID=1766165 RepID=A0ABV7L3Z3_9PROT